MRTIKLYSPAELKKKNPQGFEKAHDWFRSTNDEIPWQREIIDSLKAVFKASNLDLRDYEISAFSHSWLQFDCDSDVADLSGNRALAWLENNLLASLRIKFQPFGRVDKEHQWVSTRATLSKYGQFYRAGMVPPCPFTGVCFDEDYLESLRNDIKSGSTIKEAYKNLAHVAGKLFEAEIEQQNSEENFLEQDHLEFTIEGVCI